jgi:DNA gyrase subunit A
MLSTELGQAIRFSEKDIRPMGRGAAGVRGMKLKGKDLLMSMDLIGKDRNSKDLQVLVVTENGLGKKTDLEFYKIQKRGGSGIKTLKVTDKTGKIISMHIISGSEAYDLVLLSRSGQALRTGLDSISTLGRATQGVRVMRLDPNDKIASSTIISSS